MPADSDAEVWLRFALTQGMGCRTRLALLRHFGSPDAVLGAGVAALRAIVDAKQAAALQVAADQKDWPELLAHLQWLEARDNHLLTLADQAFPSALLDLPDPPPILFVKGDPLWLSRPALSIVGSRQATPQGLENAQAFAAELSRCGYTVISGMALGIDAAAHRGGLMGSGSTCAIIGTGADRIYPASNRELAYQIASQGVIVSEFPLGSPPVAEHFPRRNRLIAALGMGCLVVEAALGSGSLITARQAADLGREVFAIPGSIHSPQSKGVHQLIKQGAKLVESAQDILEELKLPLPLPFDAAPKEGVPESSLLQAMGWDPVDMDTLLLRPGVSADGLTAELLALELDGRIVSLPGGRYQRKG